MDEYKDISREMHFETLCTRNRIRKVLNRRACITGSTLHGDVYFAECRSGSRCSQLDPTPLHIHSRNNGRNFPLREALFPFGTAPSAKFCFPVTYEFRTAEWLLQHIRYRTRTFLPWLAVWLCRYRVLYQLHFFIQPTKYYRTGSRTLKYA